MRVTLQKQAIQLRLLRPTDGPLLSGFCGRLSAASIYWRFMTPVVPPANALLGRLLDVDHREREAVLALDVWGAAGVARYARAASRPTYEVAVVVADEWQRKGLGSLLVTVLARLARRRGIRSFSVSIAGDNVRAKAFVNSLAPWGRLSYSAGLVEGEIPLLVTGHRRDWRQALSQALLID